MGLLNGTETLEYVTDIVGDVSQTTAVAVLQDFSIFLETSPHHDSHKKVDAPKRDFTLPSSSASRAVRPKPAECYEVIERVPGVAAKLLPGKMTTMSYYQVFHLTDGVLLHANMVLDVATDVEFVVREGGSGSSGLQLVERVEVNCSRLVIGMVAQQYREAWTGFHEAYVRRMGGSVGKQTKRDQAGTLSVQFV